MMKLTLLFLTILPALTWAQPDSLVSELTRDHVDISARYIGDEITLFGALSAPGQIVVKLRSPEQVTALEHKGKVGPFWLGQGKYRVSGAPALYYLLSSAPIDTLLSPAERHANSLYLSDALTDLRLDPRPPEAELSTLKTAIQRLKKKRREYLVDPRGVKIVGQRLYSTVVHLPAQLPLGDYRLDIYLVRDGKVTATEHESIRVEEVHLEHWVSRMATQWPWTFGVIFTLSILVLGLLLGMLLDRGNKG